MRLWRTGETVSWGSLTVWRGWLAWRLADLNPTGSAQADGGHLAGGESMAGQGRLVPHQVRPPSDRERSGARGAFCAP